MIRRGRRGVSSEATWKETVKKRIYKDIYTVKVPYLATITTDERDFSGVPKDMLGREYEATTVGLTIFAMAKVASAGLYVRIGDPNQIPGIYDSINAHLDIHEKKLMGLHKLDANDDVAILKDFQNMIVQNNKFLLNKEFSSGRTGSKVTTKAKKIALKPINPNVVVL